jgi:hypothetical protein
MPSSQANPGEPGLQENEISLFSIYLDSSGSTCIGVQSFYRAVMLSCCRDVVMSSYHPPQFGNNLSHSANPIPGTL